MSIETTTKLPSNFVFYLQFMNSRGTWDNVQLVLTSLVLLHYSYITHEEIRNAVDAYTLQCRAKEKKSEYLELTFETVQ